MHQFILFILNIIMCWTRIWPGHPTKFSLRWRIEMIMHGRHFYSTPPRMSFFEEIQSARWRRWQSICSRVIPHETLLHSLSSPPLGAKATKTLYKLFYLSIQYVSSYVTSEQKSHRVIGFTMERSLCARKLAAWHLLRLVEHMVDKASSSTADKGAQTVHPFANVIWLDGVVQRRRRKHIYSTKKKKKRLTHSSFSFWIFSGSVSCMFLLNCCLTIPTRSSVLYFC